MFGSIYGDIVGSIFEFNNTYTKDFKIDQRRSRFTDDTVLTIATMDAILHPLMGFNVAYKYYFRKYVDSHRGFGGNFYKWGFTNSLEPYNSYGNGSGMRISPIGIIARSVDEVLKLAKHSASATHNHPEGIKGAQAIALAIYYAKQHKDKAFIKKEIEDRFNYNLDLNVKEIQAIGFDETCQITCPIAIYAFLIANDFEDVIKTAISFGGDSDTIACMAGGIAEAYYGITKDIVEFVLDYLDIDMKNTLLTFYDKFDLKIIDDLSE